MVAGQLEVVMLANLARLEQDMRKATGIVAGATKNMESSLSGLKSLLGTIGVGVSIGGFAAIIKGSIDALDKINDLTKSTNIAAETLAGLGLAAKQSGGDLESIAASINKLSINMGKEPEKFKALGISAKEPIEAFKQLADLFTQLQDPQQRAAVMAQALGKAWAGAAPLLAEGGTRIGEMIEKGTKLTGVTSELVKQADDFNDKLTELTGGGHALLGVIGPLLPMLNVLADDMLRARNNADGLTLSFSPLLEIMKVLLVVGSDVVFIFTTMGKDIARAMENVKLVVTGRWEESRKLGQLFAEDAKRARTELDAWQKKITEIGSSGAGGTGGANGKTAAQLAAERDSAARAKAFLADGKEADSFYRNTVKSLNEKLIVDKQILEVSRLQLAIDALSAKQRAELSPIEEADLKRLAAKVDLKNHEKKLSDMMIKSEEVIADQRKEDAEAFAAAKKVRDEALASGFKQLEQMEFEITLIGKTNQEREIAIKMRELETSEIDKSTESYKKLRDSMKDAIIKKDQAEEAKRVSVDMWKSFEDAGHQAFLSLFDTSKSVLERIGAMIKTHLIEALYQLTVKPFIIQFVAQMSGQGVAQSALGSSGGLGLSNLSSLTNFMPGGGLANGAASVFGPSNFTAGLAGDAFMPGMLAGGGGAALGTAASMATINASAAAAMGGATAAGAAAAGAGTAAAGAGAAAAGAGAMAASAIPYVGWAIAAYALLSSMSESNALPEVEMGFSHPGVDQSRFSSDEIYRQAVTQSEAAHRANFGVTWTQPNANGDGSPVDAVRRDIESIYKSLIGPINELAKAEQELAGVRIKAVSDATGPLRQAYDRESGELKRMADEWGNASKSLRDYASTLSGSVTGITYTTALRQFNAVAMSAQGGDISAMGDLQGAGETFRIASLGRSASALDYARDVARIRRTVSSTADFADTQESVALQQLDALETQVSTLIDINGELVTVNEAMATLNAATDELRASLTDQARDTKSTKDLITAVANGSISLYIRDTQVPA